MVAAERTVSPKKEVLFGCVFVLYIQTLGRDLDCSQVDDCGARLSSGRVVHGTQHVALCLGEMLLREVWLCKFQTNCCAEITRDIFQIFLSSPKNK